jgi:hypothetical protein
MSESQVMLLLGAGFWVVFMLALILRYRNK